MHPDAKIKTPTELGTPKRDPEQLFAQHKKIAEFIRLSRLPLQDMTNFANGSRVFAHDPSTGFSIEVHPFDGVKINKRHDGKDKFDGYTAEQKKAVEDLVRSINSGLVWDSARFDGEPNHARSLRADGQATDVSVVDWSKQGGGK